MKYFLFILFFIPTIAWADNCTMDFASGDRTCVDGNVTYVYPSQSTLEARAAAQADIDAQKQADMQQEQLIQDDMRSLAVQDLQSQGLITYEQATTTLGKLGTLNTAKTTLNAGKVNGTSNPVVTH